MKIYRHITDWQQARKQWHDKSIGLVTTMGCLHTGHLSLLETANKENDVTVLTIFVNPTQFNNKNDYDNYPKTEDNDILLARKTQVDALLILSEDEMYPDGFNFKIHNTHPISQIMEGSARPGHFNGMLTIVLKLLNLVNATNVYFGEKDFQQYILVKEMAAAFLCPTNVIACPTYRETTSLAYSSRNTRLSRKGKKQAERFAQILQQEGIDKIEQTLLAENFNVDYVQHHQGRIFAAVYIDNIRLIDNVKR